jgi:hypothetical protein
VVEAPGRHREPRPMLRDGPSPARMDAAETSGGPPLARRSSRLERRSRSGRGSRHLLRLSPGAAVACSTGVSGSNSSGLAWTIRSDAPNTSPALTRRSVPSTSHASSRAPAPASPSPLQHLEVAQAVCHRDDRARSPVRVDAALTGREAVRRAEQVRARRSSRQITTTSTSPRRALAQVLAFAAAALLVLARDRAVNAWQVVAADRGCRARRVDRAHAPVLHTLAKS